MPKTKVEVYDKDQLIYPFIESDHVTFSNGMKITEMLDQSISMPKVTHEDSSFKVGVGDQDVSSSIVDSSVADMTIKGQTYQNILPEPTLRNKMIGKSMQRLNEGYDNIEVVDGVSKSAILKGQTLVNMAPKYKGIKNDFFSIDGGGHTQEFNAEYYKVIANDSNCNIALRLYAKEKWQTVQPLKLNAKYLAIVDLDVQVSKNIHLNCGKVSYSGPYGKTLIPGNGRQIVKLQFTTPTEIDANTNQLNIGTDLYSVAGDYVAFYSINIIEYQEGMENWDIPYFEGMQSVKMPVLKTTGKNLFDVDNILYNTWVDSSNPNSVGGGNTRNTLDFTKVKPNQKIIASGLRVTGAYGYDANKKFIEGINSNIITTTGVIIPPNVYYIRLTFDNTVDFSNAQLEYGSTSTTYEPYKSNILTTNEEVELRGIGDVQDTLDLMTREKVERIGEIVLDGSQSAIGGGYIRINNAISDWSGNDKYLLSDRLPTSIFIGSDLFTTPTLALHGALLYVRGFNSNEEITEYFRNNPTTVQYRLAEESIKTVDLSSSGNWEKVVLDGSNSNTIMFYKEDSNTIGFRIVNLFFKNWYTMNTFSNELERLSTIALDAEGFSHGDASADVYIRINKDKLTSLDANGFKQYLQQNPITLYYQTQTHQDSTQVKQPIFFKDGHIIQSSGADNSLIPTLDYQAKTSNSYMMDLMKTNTKYTMKAKSASGTFTIDGTSYNVNANGIFTTPTSMTNKLLVMSNKTNEEVMIIEGDVVSKTIPYFKGIKSAFEDEDKIEVLSTGKNLFDGAFEKGVIDANGNLGYAHTAIRTVNYISVKPNTSYHINLPNLELFEILRVLYVHEYDENFKVLGEVQVGNRNIYTSKSATKFIKINTHTAHDLPVDSKMIVCENSTLDKQYEPYKSNSTKIPLLSPLRSLPNGVCDEIILDRENNKAKIIQRVGKVILDGSENWGYTPDWVKGETIGFYLLNDKSNGFCLSDKFIFYHGINSVDHECVSFPKNAWLGVRIKVDKLGTQDVDGFKQYLQQNPLTVYYDLATPIVTEIDLEGYPYVYKDGHIFLNSEVAPTTEIIYSINQAQQIESANENLQRHEKEISRLQKLIAQYIQVEYESTLLSLKI